jgi:4'-phosphopantetheinyl transferase
MTEPGRVTVSIWPLALSAARLDALRAVLAADELERVARARVASVARDFIASRGIVRELLARDCGCAPDDIAFDIDAKGKPHLAYPQRRLAFNISHSGGYCTLATGQFDRIGLDIEAIRPTVGDLAPSVLSSREITQYAALPAADQMPTFFRAWVAKEAYLKATGEGLGGGLQSLELDLTTTAVIRPIAIKGDACAPTRWHFHGFDIGNRIVGAVAVPSTGEELHIDIRHLDVDD